MKKAVNTHERLMEEARRGQGIDRHLFGLWCASYEANLPMPELYDDVLFKKRYVFVIIYKFRIILYT